MLSESTHIAESARLLGARYGLSTLRRSPGSACSAMRAVARYTGLWVAGTIAPFSIFASILASSLRSSG